MPDKMLRSTMLKFYCLGVFVPEAHGLCYPLATTALVHD